MNADTKSQGNERQGNKANAELLEWAIGRWNAEVKNRPLVNIHRRALDDTWRQVVRYAGGDDRKLLGKPHDELMSEI